jgi:type I restriction enzyme S subunit
VRNVAARAEMRWKTRRFDSITTIANGMVNPTESQYVDAIRIGPENIESGTGRITNTATARELGLISGKYTFDQSAIVYSKIRPNLNKVCMPPFSGICSADAYPIWPAADVVTREYVFYYMISPMFLDQSVRVSMRTGMPKINRDDLGAIKVPLPPPLLEQQKIAAILSTWDRAIELTEKLIAAKQKRKRALMQQLLTGKVRFKEFVKSQEVFSTRYGDYPKDWTYGRIEDIAKEVSERNAEGTLHQVLSCTKYDGLVDSLTYFGRQIFSEDLSTYKVVRRNQFAYATNHIEEGSIGYQDVCDTALISPMYTVFETTSGVDDGFLFKLLKSDLYVHIYQTNMSASVDRLGSLRWGDFSRIRIPLPSMEEQRRISEVLNRQQLELDKLEKKPSSCSSRRKALCSRF